MSDPMPDPIDQAYVEAEAVLSDEAERAARRARVLAAVAEAPAAAPAVRRPLWRRGGWLVAASVAGLAVIVASQVYRPFTPPPPSHTEAAPAGPSSKNNAVATSTSPRPAQVVAPPKAIPPALQARPVPEPVIVASPPAPSVVSPDVEPPALRGSPSAESAPPPPPPPAAPPGPAPNPVQGGVVASLQPPAANGAAADSGGANNSADSVSEMVVTAARRQQSIQRVPTAVSAFTAKQRDVAAAKPETPANAGVSLRAAAGAGRTADVEALLEQGAPVDAPDAKGDTALIKAVQADHADTAALLRRHGASLDHKNHAGQSARDLAKAKGDPALDQALGLSP